MAGGGGGVCMAEECAWQGIMHGRGSMHGGGMCGRGHVWQGGMCGRGACMAEGGMHGRGVCMAGVCMVRGMHGRGACVAGGVWQERWSLQGVVSILLECSLVTHR